MSRYFRLLAIVTILACCDITWVDADGGGQFHCYECGNNGSIFTCDAATIGFASCTVSGTTCTLGGTDCTPQGVGCFLAGTLIDTEGGRVPIQNIQVGDKVLAQTEDGRIVLAEVLDVYRYLSCQHYVVNDDIEVTATHPFRVGDDWVSTDKVVVGDELRSRNDEPIVVRSIERVSRGSRVYNLHVSGPETFFANGVLVHNKSQPGQG